MKRLAIMVALIAATATVSPALAEPAHPPICGGWRFDLSNPDTRTWRGPHLVACVFSFLGMYDQIDYAQFVADRETGGTYDPTAYNSSGAAGLYQHLLRYWRGRAHTFLPLWRFPNRDTVSPFNAQANVWVTARMVKAGGWGPWRK